MNKAHSRNAYVNQVAIVWALLAAIVLSIGLYIYFVNVTVLQTATRQHLEESIIDIKSQISQLELEYIESNRGITKEYAQTLGFTEPAELVFVTREDTRLSFNESGE